MTMGPRPAVAQQVRADSIKEGDAFLHEDGRVAWHAVTDAYLARDHHGHRVVAVDVRHHPDGGLDTRWFGVDQAWPQESVRRAPGPRTAA